MTELLKGGTRAFGIAMTRMTRIYRMRCFGHLFTHLRCHFLKCIPRRDLVVTMQGQPRKSSLEPEQTLAVPTRDALIQDSSNVGSPQAVYATNGCWFRNSEYSHVVVRTVHRPPTVSTI
jgi:hypothetical protein